MKKRKIWGYGAGSLGKDFVNIVISSYLLIFYTDILGISAAAAGVIMMATKIWDAVNDPMMGVIADRTRTRWGKFRPYILFVPIPLSVFTVLTFTPVDFSYTGKIIWATVTYVITNTLFTAYDVPMLGMVPSLTTDSNDRNRLFTSSRFFTTIAIMLGSTFAYPLIQKLGGGSSVENLAKGYPLFLTIVGVISVIFAWTAFASTKEVVNQNEKVVSLRKLLATLRSNKPLMVLQGANLFFSMGMMVGTSVGVYYIIYFIQRPELIASYMFTLTVSFTISTFFVPILLKRISKETFITSAVVIMSICNVVLFLYAKENIALLFALSAVSSGCSFAPAIVLTTMVSDVADNTEYEKGYRADGVMFSVNSFIIKVATAINSGLIGFMLSKSGYNASAAVQSESTLLGLNLIRCVYPILTLGICVIILKFYPLKEGKMEQIAKALTEKRGNTYVRN